MFTDVWESADGCRSSAFGITPNLHPGGGMALLDTVRGELPKALIFMVSGQMNPKNVQGALQRGVHGFIVKPFNADTVLTTIRNAILKLARQQKIKTEG